MCLTPQFIPSVETVLLSSNFSKTFRSNAIDCEPVARTSREPLRWVLRKKLEGTFKILAFVSVWVDVANLRLSVKKHTKSAFTGSVPAGSNMAIAHDSSRCAHVPFAVYSVQPLLCIIVCASTYVSADVTIDDTG